VDSSKTCTICGVTYPANKEYFYENRKKGCKHGLHSRCKTCHDAYSKKRREERSADSSFGSFDASNTKECTTCGGVYPATPEYYYKDFTGKYMVGSVCKICANKRAAEYRACPETHNRIKKQKREHYAANKEAIREKQKEYFARPETKEKVNAHQRKRYAEDVHYRLTNNLRSRMCWVLKGKNKSESTKKLLGCSIEELVAHLEAQFQPGMTWDNHGEWQLDHIRPCASFDLSKPSDQQKCFHYTNLQPLWAKDNRSKYYYYPELVKEVI
jgi:hypothetical protein